MLYLLRAKAAKRAIVIESMIAKIVMMIELTKVSVNRSFSQIFA